MLIQSLFYLGLALLFLASFIPLVFQRYSRITRKISLSLTFAGILLFIIFSLIVLKDNSTLHLNVAELANILHFDFLIDRLAAFFILLVATVALPVIIYSWSYIDHLAGEQKNALLVFSMNIFIASLIFIITAANTLLFLFFWELMAISSFLLVYHDHDKEDTRRAGLYYFIMTSLSTIFLLLAFIVFYNTTGSLDMTMRIPLTAGLSTFAFICLFLGFGIKSGIIPFHKWLPYAHPAAPSNISALLSGIMIKIGIYGLIRFVMYVLPAYELGWGITILLAGTASAILGVIYALKEHDIKRLLAYHSIENIGIILIGFGLHVIFTYYQLPVLAALSLAGALLHTFNHALFKSLLFLTAGSVVHSTKTKNIESMGGLIKTMPATAILFFIGAASISALPPLNGFISEFMLFQSFFSGYLITNHLVQILLVICASVLALTSALAAACFVKAFAIIFLGVPRTEDAKHSKEMPLPMLIGPALLACFCIFIGVFSYQIAAFFGYSFDIPNMVYISAFLLITLIILWLTIARTASTRLYETWGCGYGLSGGKTEYTASGFSQPIVTIFSPIFRPRIRVDKKYIDGHQVLLDRGEAHIILFQFFKEKVYLPVIRFFETVSTFIQGFNERDLDTYIAYVFVVCLVLIIFIGVF